MTPFVDMEPFWRMQRKMPQKWWTSWELNPKREDLSTFKTHPQNAPTLPGMPIKMVEMVGAAPTSLKSLNRADSSHACRHSFLADDDLNPFLSSRTARIRHAWIGAYLNFHLFDGWRHAIPRLSELSLCLTTYPNSGFFRWHRSQTRLRVRTLRSQLLLVDFIEKPFDRLLHASQFRLQVESNSSPLL